MSLQDTFDEFIRGEHYNYNSPTDLCNLMDHYGSDKGPNCKNAGNYSKLYDYLLKDSRSSVSYVFEVGLGTNNTDVPSSMGVDGIPGASLRGWRDYFPNAKIIGADVDSRILFKEKRIETYYVNQFDTTSIQDLWKRFVDIDFDFIIDDGIHDIAQGGHGNTNFFENSIHKLKKNGLYIIEDVATDDSGDYVSGNNVGFVDKVNGGYYGNDLKALIAKVPAYRNDKNTPARQTQVIIMKRY